MQWTFGSTTTNSTRCRWALPTPFASAGLSVSAMNASPSPRIPPICIFRRTTLEGRFLNAVEGTSRISRSESSGLTGSSIEESRSLPCPETNALAIRTRRKPLRVTRKNLRDYLLNLRETSMPHEVGAQFQFFVGDFGEHLALYVTENLHYLKLSICSGVLFESMPYPYLDYLCQDALGNNQIFLKTAE